MLKLSFFVLLMMIMSNGCSYLKRRGDWGKNALWPISGNKVSRAFVKNLKSPYVWAPVTGAGIIHFSGYDEKITKWASEYNPIFGSQENAAHYSDKLRDVLYIETGISVLLTPSWDGSEGDYIFSKAKGATVAYFSFSLSEDFTNTLRKNVKRERPNETDLRSLPSGHVTGAAATEAILRRNVNELGLSSNWTQAINGLNTTLAAGVAWGRLESNSHFASDVLLAYSIGNFVSGFIFDSLMNLDSNEHVTLYPNEKNGMTLSYLLTF